MATSIDGRRGSADPLDLFFLLEMLDALPQTGPEPQGDDERTATVRAELEQDIVRALSSSVPRYLLLAAARTLDGKHIRQALNFPIAPVGTRTEYRPDQVSHPSETIRETLDSLGKRTQDLIVAGLGAVYADRLVEGKAPIAGDAPEALEEVTGVPACFWRNRQAQYDAATAGGGRDG